MTIAAQAVPAHCVGDGNVTRFDFAFKLLEESDLCVYVTDHLNDDELTKLASTQYEVHLVYQDEDDEENTGGYITYPLAGDPLPPTSSITIFRETDIKQGARLPSYSRIIEKVLDRAFMVLQENKERTDRCLAIPINDNGETDPDIFLKETVENATEAKELAGQANTAASAAQTVATEAKTAADQAADDSAAAVTASEGAAETAGAANETAGNAATLASQLEQLVNQKVNEINTAVLAVADKVDCDGGNIDRLPFLVALGISPEGEVDFSDFALTSGSNIDVAAYRFGLGIDELDSSLSDLENSAADTSGSNINVAAYSEKLGLSDLANTAGTNLDVVSYKAALAPRIVTTLAGITGNYVGEQVLRISGVADDPDDDIYFWDGSNWCKEGI